jgi:hypothetical protein
MVNFLWRLSAHPLMAASDQIPGHSAPIIIGEALPNLEQADICLTDGLLSRFVERLEFQPDTHDFV